MPDDVFGGFGSNGMPFLLTVIPISSRRCSASLPVTPNGVTSARMRWLSVPPEISRMPSPVSVSAIARALARTWRWYVAELVAQGELEADGLARDDVLERAALDAREDAPVDRRREVRLDHRVVGRIGGRRELASAEDESAARAAEGLVGRRRDEVGVRERARVEAGRDEPGDVGHVDPQERPDRVGDVGHPLEVDDPRIGAGAADDQLRAGPPWPAARARRSRSARRPGGRRSRGSRSSGR